MKKRFIKAISANYIFLIISILFFLIITPVAIKVMGEEFYGLWAIINSILLFSSVGTFGMGLVVNKFAAEEGDNALDYSAILTAGATIVLLSATVIGCILLIFRHWISDHLVTDPFLQKQLSSALIFTALSLYPQFLSRVFQGYLFSQLRYDLGQMVETGKNIALWTGAVWIAWMTHNIVWMTLWGFFIYIVAAIVYFNLVERRCVLQWKWDPLSLRRMGSFSGFAFVQSIAISLYQNFDRIVVGFVLGPTIAGVYSVGTSVGLRLSIVTGQITNVLIPYASRKGSLNQSKELYMVFRKISRIINLMLMLLGSLLILWMDIILRYWISEEYSDSYANIFCILILAYLLLSASMTGQQTLDGIGQVRLTSIIYLTTTILMLIILYYASSNWGLAGAAASNLIMIMLLSFPLLVPRFLGERRKAINDLLDLIKLTLFPVAIYIFVVFIPFNMFLRLLITSLLIFLALIFVLMDTEIRKQISDYANDYFSRRKA